MLYGSFESARQQDSWGVSPPLRTRHGCTILLGCLRCSWSYLFSDDEAQVPVCCNWGEIMTRHAHVMSVVPNYYRGNSPTRRTKARPQFLCLSTTAPIIMDADYTTGAMMVLAKKHLRLSPSAPVRMVDASSKLGSLNWCCDRMGWFPEFIWKSSRVISDSILLIPT